MPNEKDSLNEDLTDVRHIVEPGDNDSVSLGDESTASDVENSAFENVDELLDEAGEIVDLALRYELKQVLGKGGMGEVILAHDRRLKRPVAVKRVKSEISGSARALRRFLTEAQAIAALNHFHIVQVYDYGRDAAGPFLILEFVEGETLAERLKQGALDVEVVLKVANQICDALIFAHERTVYHRDIKPANILLTCDDFAKLTDFGLARVETDVVSNQTQTGAVLGTLDFMPLEQRRNAAAVDARSDIWSLAATTYQMLTGRSPKVIRLDGIPESLKSVLSRALEDDPDDRFQSVAEFQTALRSAGSADNSRHVGELASGQCPECNAFNSGSARFCKECGGALQVSCLGCDEKIPVWERFCTLCGVSQREQLTTRLEALAAAREEAESLKREYRYDEAVNVAIPLLAITDPRLGQETAWVPAFLANVEQEVVERTEAQQRLISEAGQFTQECRYKDALRVLDSMPSGLRNDEIETLIKQAESTLEELEQLRQKIRDGVAAKDTCELLPNIERYLELRPQTDSMLMLRQQLLDRQEREAAREHLRLQRSAETLREAQKLFDSGDDLGVIRCVSRVSETDCAEALVKLREHATQRQKRVRELTKQLNDGSPRTESDKLRLLLAYINLRPNDTDVSLQIRLLKSRLRAARTQRVITFVVVALITLFVVLVIVLMVSGRIAVAASLSVPRDTGERIARGRLVAVESPFCSARIGTNAASQLPIAPPSNSSQPLAFQSSNDRPPPNEDGYLEQSWLKLHLAAVEIDTMIDGFRDDWQDPETDPRVRFVFHALMQSRHILREHPQALASQLQRRRFSAHKPLLDQVQQWPSQDMRIAWPTFQQVGGPLVRTQWPKDGTGGFLFRFRGEKWLSSASRSINVWDFRSTNEVTKLTGKGALIECAALAPDWTKLVVGTNDKEVEIWETEPVVGCAVASASFNTKTH